MWPATSLTEGRTRAAVIAATASAPTADQAPAADEAATTEADVEALKALEEK